MSKTVKKPYAVRVADFHKLDSNVRITKFQAQNIAAWKEQIEIRKSDIKKVKSQMDELNTEKTEEVLLNVDPNRIKDIESRETYRKEYTKALLNVRAEEKTFLARIDTLKEEQANFEWLILLLTD